MVIFHAPRAMVTHFLMDATRHFVLVNLLVNVSLLKWHVQVFVPTLLPSSIGKRLQQIFVVG
ncbi:hypothetical protein Bhyg_06600, partial [Pseudolycoriella hygida]